MATTVNAHTVPIRWIASLVSAINRGASLPARAADVDPQGQGNGQPREVAPSGTKTRSGPWLTDGSSAAYLRHAEGIAAPSLPRGTPVEVRPRHRML